MPQYLIRFDQPVDYLRDHPKACRLGITELLVNSDSLSQAKAHALRTTSGPGSIVEESPDAPPLPTEPSVEAPEAALPENLRA